MSEKNFEGAANKAGIGGGEALGRRLRLLGPAAGTAIDFESHPKPGGGQKPPPQSANLPKLTPEVSLPSAITPSDSLPSVPQAFCFGSSPCLHVSRAGLVSDEKTHVGFFRIAVGQPPGPGPAGVRPQNWVCSFKLLGFEFKPALSAASRIHLRLQFAVFKLSERAVSCPDR